MSLQSAIIQWISTIWIITCTSDEQIIQSLRNRAMKTETKPNEFYRQPICRKRRQKTMNAGNWLNEEAIRHTQTKKEKNNNKTIQYSTTQYRTKWYILFVLKTMMINCRLICFLQFHNWGWLLYGNCSLVPSTIVNKRMTWASILLSIFDIRWNSIYDKEEFVLLLLLMLLQLFRYINITTTFTIIINVITINGIYLWLSLLTMIMIIINLWLSLFITDHHCDYHNDYDLSLTYDYHCLSLIITMIILIINLWLALLPLLLLTILLLLLISFSLL